MAQNGSIKKERISTKAKKRAFLDALRRSLGILAPAMEVAGVKKYDTIRDWREKDPEFAAEMDECDRVCGDFVESKLLQLIKDEDTAAIIFYCKTKLKNRGYTERNEVTGKDGKDLIPPNKMTREEIQAEIERIRNIRNDK